MMLLDDQAYQLELIEPNPSDYFLKPLKQFESVIIEGNEVGVTPVFSAYWQFATERQNIFFKRLCNNPNTIQTNDHVLAKFKFTNAYRASDRVSQYLMRKVIYRDDLPQGDDEVFFRILLFKIFNKIETWEYLEEIFGSITLKNYDYTAFDEALSRKMSLGGRVYSAAYIMPSAGSVFGCKLKHQNHLLLLEHLLQQHFPKKLRACKTMAEAYALMLSVPSFGPFLAYQYVTDLNYSELTNFKESEFVIAGPGALDGIDKCFNGLGGLSAETVIKYMFENQDRYFDELSLDFKSLWGRQLQLIDCQNIFCEISKYARVAFPDIAGLSGRKRIKQKFAVGRSLSAPWYPPKWGINAQVNIDN